MPSPLETFPGQSPTIENNVEIEAFFNEREELPEDVEQVSQQPILLHFVNQDHLKNHPEIAAILREYISSHETDLDEEQINAEMEKIYSLLETVRNIGAELTKEASGNELPQALLNEAHGVVELYKKKELTRDGILISTGENYWNRLRDRSPRGSMEALILYLNDALFTRYIDLRTARKKFQQAA